MTSTQTSPSRHRLIALAAATGLLLPVFSLYAAQPAPTTRPATAPALAPASEADPLLGERLLDLASETLQSETLSTSRYRQAGALLEAAARLNPTEPRFARLRYEAMLQAGDVAGAIQSLVAYARLDTTDLAAQAKLIELYAQRMETAEEKLKYLRDDLVAIPSIPAEVRSHAGVMACRVLIERGDRAAAASMANDAARLNPLNAEAQRLRFDLSLRDGTPLDRINGLLAIVRASPLDLGAVLAVADELSVAGLDESAQWYDAALGLSVRNGTPPPRSMIIDYAARLLISGQPRDAEGLVGRVLDVDPDDISAHFVRLSMERLQGEPGQVALNKARARTALTNRLARIALAAGDSAATTRPAQTSEAFPPPDPVATADRVVAKQDPGLTDAFVTAASDLAFFHLFFQEDPGPPVALIEGLKKVLPAESPLLARLEGWLFLIRKEDASARVKLSAVEADDRLAALGMLRLEADTPEGKQAAETRARGLRSAGSHGVLGAIIFSDLAARKTPLVLSNSADQMRKILEGHPKQLLRLIDAPQTFYFLRAEPLTPVVEFGRPILLRLTLINSSDQDLAMGPQGALRNDLFFSAQIRGLRPQSFPAVAFDRLAGPLVLRPRQTASRIVRLDQGRLLSYLRLNPYTTLPITGSAFTNPASVGGKISPGAGGYEVQFTRVVEQSPVPIVRPEQRQALLDGLSTAPPAQRIGLIDAGVVYYNALVATAAADQQEAPARLRSALDALASDPDPTARSWGTFWGLLLTKGETRSAKAFAAANDPYWVTRLLALAGLRGGEFARYRELADHLTADPDPTVARYARAVLEEVEERIAAAAATRPATDANPDAPPATAPASPR